MADTLCRTQRSEVMSRIKSCGNRRTELALVSLLRTEGIHGWRRHFPILGRPDFAFPQQKLAVFVDGCFWHGCSRCYRRPKSNQRFWDEKLRANRQRDRHVSKTLRRSGWSVVRIWEHQLRSSPDVAVRRIRRSLDRRCAA
jgi:DNA mismatch endonuclease (patch repair protein)